MACDADRRRDPTPIHTLVAVIEESRIGGVSTPRVDALVQTMRLSGIPKSAVSKLCEEIGDCVGEFPNHPPTRDRSSAARSLQRWMGGGDLTELEGVEP